MAYLAPEDAKRVLEHRARVAKECRESFPTFMRYAWPYISPDPNLIWGPPQDILCEHLEAVYAGKINRLITNIPPRTGKSRFTSIGFPAWVWLHDPKTQFIVASHGDKVVQQFGDALVKLLQSGFYHTLQPEAEVRPNVAHTNIVNKAGGTWFGTTPHGQLMGIGGDILMFDDIVDPDGVDKAENEAVKQWIPETFMSRANRKDRAKFIGIGQRLRENDPYGFCLEQGWFPLVLPSRYEGAPCVRVMPNGEEIIQDWRSQVGELLCPELLPAWFLEDCEKLYPRIYAGQYQQRPAPAGGGIIQTAWLEKRWTTYPADGTWLLSVDATFKDSDGSDYVVIQVWVHKGNEFWLVDQVRRKMGFWDTLGAIRAVVATYPKLAASFKIIEDKANGTAIIETLQKEMYGVEGVNPEGGKEARAQAVSACFAGGGVWLPHVFKSDPGTTVGQYTHELEVFPGGKNDDQVDATTQALNWYVQRERRIVPASRSVLQALAGEYTGIPEAVPPIVQAGMAYRDWRAGQLGR